LTVLNTSYLPGQLKVIAASFGLLEAAALIAAPGPRRGRRSPTPIHLALLPCRRYCSPAALSSPPYCPNAAASSRLTQPIYHNCEGYSRARLVGLRVFS
jgi:hypothetical protein